MPNLDLDMMRQSGRILGETLRFLDEEFIQPGVTTLDVSKKAEEIIRSYGGAVPAFLGYKGFPEAACVSLNCEVVHAIPRKEMVISSGDIVSVDCGVILEGHFTDACRTTAVGHIGSRTAKLLKVTQDALNKGIAAAWAGNRIGDISYAVQKHVERHRFKVSLDYVGHGIGLVLHGPPCVPNYGPPGIGDLIELGTCLAIEPVVFDGPTDTVLLDDRWTVVSEFNSLSAHFEETIIVTEDGPEIVTR